MVTGRFVHRVWYKPDFTLYKIKTRSATTEGKVFVFGESAAVPEKKYRDIS